MSAVTLGGDLVHYEVLGRGRPVLLLHSWVGSWRYWVPTLQQLQTKYRVYALDLYGFGDSAKNSKRYPLDHQVQLLVDFMTHLAIPKAALVGHGLGALVTIEFARLYPDKAPRIFLVSAPLFDPGGLDKRPPPERSTTLTDHRQRPAQPQPVPGAEATIANPSTVLAMRAALQARAAQIESIPSAATSVSEPAQAAPKHNPLSAIIGDGASENLLAKCFRRSEPEYDKLAVDVPKTDPAALKTVVSHFDSGRVLDTLYTMQMPTVLLHGLDDPIIPAPNDNVWRYVTTNKDDTMLPISLPGVRHFPMLEYERFTRLVTDFLEAPDISKLEIKERWKRRTR